MTAFPAKFASNCPRCKDKINVGDMITARSRHPWVHDGCALVLKKVETGEVIAWRKFLQQAGFLHVVDSGAGSLEVWILEGDNGVTDAESWLRVDESLNQLWFYLFIRTLGFTVSAQKADQVRQLWHLLSEKTAAADLEFEAYRQALIEKMGES